MKNKNFDDKNNALFFDEEKKLKRSYMK